MCSRTLCEFRAGFGWLEIGDNVVGISLVKYEL